MKLASFIFSHHPDLPIHQNFLMNVPTSNREFYVNKIPITLFLAWSRERLTKTNK